MNDIRLTIAASAVLALFPTNALADQAAPIPTIVGPPTTRIVRTDDLDLRSERDRHRLVSRIAAAAEFVCKDEGGPSATPTYGTTTCYHAAVADGRAQMRRLLQRGPGPAIAAISVSAARAAR